MADNTIIYIVLSLAFVVGACIGSFVTMASHRLAIGEDTVFKPSYCPCCNTALAFRDLFPLLSWAVSRGKCRHCAKPVSIRYPLIELTSALTFVALVFFFGLTLKTLFLCLLATEILILIVTDLEHTIIPDSVQIALLITGIAYDVYLDLAPAGVISSITLGLTLGLALHYGSLLILKKDGLGWGDVKFLAVAGAWLPLIDFVPFIFLSGLIGTLTGLFWRLKHKGAVFPFGPALAASLFINVLFPNLLERIVL